MGVSLSARRGGEGPPAPLEGLRACCCLGAGPSGSQCGSLCELAGGLGLPLLGAAFGWLLALLAVEFPPWGPPSWAVKLVSWLPRHCLGARAMGGALGQLAPPEGSEGGGAPGLHSQESQGNWPGRVVGEALEGFHS